MKLKVSVLLTLISLALSLLAVFAITFKTFDKSTVVVKKEPSVKRGNISDINNKKTVKKLRVPIKHVYLGVDTELTDNSLPKFEKNAGKKMAVVLQYIYWGAKKPYFDRELAEILWEDNKVLVITWNPSKSVPVYSANQPQYRFKNILRGDFDNYIKTWVNQLKGWRRPVIIRFAPEMNGDWLPWGDAYTTPSEYRKTYRYVVDFFKRSNVKNVSWMWSPNEAGEIFLADYYPGDEYVDWVGLSSFNWGGLRDDLGWRDFDALFKQSFDQLKKIKKPIAIVETGSIEKKTDPQAKSVWIKNTFHRMKNKYPEVKMFIYFNGVSFNIYDWRIETSDHSINAYKNAISEDYFLGRIKTDKIPE